MKRTVIGLVMLVLVGIGLSDTVNAQTDSSIEGIETDINELQTAIESLSSSQEEQQSSIETLQTEVNAIKEDIAEIRALLVKLLGDSEDEEADTTPTNDRSELSFNLNDPSVYEQFVTTTAGDTQYGNFIQDAITVGMTPDEVIAKYGEPDFTFELNGPLLTVYGDLAIVYWHDLPEYPVGQENVVESVRFFPDITPDELFSVLGEPDETTAVGSNENEIHYPQYEYKGLGDNEVMYFLRVITAQLENDSRLGLFTRTLAMEDLTAEDGDGEGEGSGPSITEDELNSFYAFLDTDFMVPLADYYNNGNEAVFNMLSGSALETVKLNREGDTHADFVYHDSSLQNISKNGDTYYVDVLYTLDYATIDGPTPVLMSYVVTDVDNVRQITSIVETVQ